MGDSDSGEVRQLRIEMEILKSQYREFVHDRMAAFGPRREGPWPDIFVVMPFDPRLRPIYERHIRQVASRLDLEVKRGDDIGGVGRPIIEDIRSAILGARVVIADCTARNQNVCYEIGLAHAAGRPTILIAQSLDDVPYDLQQFRVIIYENTPDGMDQFEENLADMIASIIAPTAVR